MEKIIIWKKKEIVKFTAKTARINVGNIIAVKLDVNM